jgi:DNA repair exonuclease SbcCD ATPase subunit
MDHMKLSDELRKQLLESAAWGKAGIVLSEGIVEEAAKREGTREYLEEEAVHVCPLCISQLDEEIDEESLLEHLNVVVGLVDRLSQLQEGDEDIETVIDETIQELLFPESEEE